MVKDVALKVLAELGVTHAAFSEATYAPHAPLALASLRLVSREMYAFMAHLDLPLLNALPVRLQHVERDVLYVDGLEPAITIEPRPWFRNTEVVAVVVGTAAKPAIFARAGWWQSLPVRVTEALINNAIRGKNSYVLKQAIAHIGARVFDPRALTGFCTASIRHDFLEGFFLLHNTGVPLARKEGETWKAFFANTPACAEIFAHGALHCFTFLREQAAAAGEEYDFLVAARAFFRRFVVYLAGDEAGQRLRLRDEITQRYEALAKIRRREQEHARRLEKKRMRDAAAAAAPLAAETSVINISSADDDEEPPAKRARLDAPVIDMTDA